MVGILHYLTGSDESHHTICHGASRFRVLGYEDGRTYLCARIEELPDPAESDDEIATRALFLRQQVGKAIEKAIAGAGMPEETERHVPKEPARLGRMPDTSGEYSMLRGYLDWLTELPWSTVDTESIDVARAREILDEDHFGLEKIRRRIVEYLVVRKLNPEGRSPTLCFVGPPGVGKTSLGQSIARAIGLRFVRAGLGGVHDES